MHLHRSWKTQGDAQEDHLHQGHYSQGRRRKQDQGRTEGRQEEMKCWPGATRVHNTNSTNLQENVNTSFNFTTLLYVYNTRFYFFSQNFFTFTVKNFVGYVFRCPACLGR